MAHELTRRLDISWLSKFSPSNRVSQRGSTITLSTVWSLSQSLCKPLWWAWPGYLVYKNSPWLVKCRAPWLIFLPWLKVKDNSKTRTECYPERRGPVCTASFMCQSIRLCLPVPSASHPQMLSHFMYNFWCTYFSFVLLNY